MAVDIRLTYDDYCLLPSDGKRYEIIEGELFVTPAPNFLHQIIVTRLTRYLSAFVEDNQIGLVFVSPFDVVFSQFDVVEPDVLYVSKARSSVLTDKNVQGSPDLVVEVLSPGTAKIDRTIKLKLYARFGVEEYWIIDPEGPAAEVYRHQKGSLELAATLDAHGLLASPLFPGFSLPLQKLVE
ncbi:MAG TPA: Uma2 family endonuclease [Terriglobia bacterium]|nr:Uma2 family endonuclease [Terriglobia bacterium]